MIDEDGYRPNVGIILCNKQGDVLWARRIGQDAWQFPQGGIKEFESPEDALYRELAEEVGLQKQDVEVLGSTRGWLRYRLPRRMILNVSHHLPMVRLFGPRPQSLIPGDTSGAEQGGARPAAPQTHCHSA